MSLLDQARWTKQQADASIRRVAEAGPAMMVPPASDTRVVIKYTGTRDGKRYTGHIWTDAGEQGDAVQFRFLGDAGIDDLVDLNDHLFAWPIEEWDEDNAAWSGDSAKYWSVVGPDILDPPLYKATANPSGSTITVKRCNSDGTTTGDTITLKVVP